MKAPAQEPGWLRRLAGYLLRHRRHVVISLAAALAGSGCQVVVPLVARHIVDAVITAGTSPLLPWLGLLLGLQAAVFGFGFLRRYHGGTVGLRVQNDLRTDLHAHLQSMDQATLDRYPTGQLVSRANSDAALVQGLLNLLPIMSGNVIQFVLALVVMLVLSPPLALVALLIVPALVAVSYRMRTQVLPATWLAQQREGDVAQIVDEDVNGVRVVKAFGRERYEVERLAGTAGEVYGAQMRAVRLQSRFQPLLQAVPTLGQVAVLALGGWLALNDRISIGTFLAFSAYVAQLMTPARMLAAMLAIAQQARVGAERIFQLLDRRPAITSPPHPVALPTGPLGVALDGVTVTRGGARPVLDGVTLHVAPGERVALVGASGSGKSTLIGLLPRFLVPDSGVVAVGGVDVRAAGLHALRGRIATVFEESFLFSDTVRANIAYGRPDATDAEVRAAAATARAAGFIEDLPSGYDTVVGERGLTLSGGQRQRIALARALLTDPDVLVLDDATSAVDAATEQQIHAGLRTALPGRTVLLVAHRESTLHLADRVVLLDGGRVAATGTHEHFLATNPAYRALVRGPEFPPEGVLPVGIPAPKSPEGVLPVGIRVGSPLAGVGTTGKMTASRAAAGMAPTPELLARVAALGPPKDEARVDLATEAAPDPDFRLLRVLRPQRNQLLLGLLFVTLDAAATLAGPYLVKQGVDDGVVAGSGAVLAVAALAFLAITLADVLVQTGQTFVAGRIAQRVMLSLRLRIFGQLQRLSLDFYEREMAGRIMTRMTTDVDAFENLIQNGLLSAIVSLVTFAGVGVAMVFVDPPLGSAVLTVVLPLAVATVLFRRRSQLLYTLARERVAVMNADFQESLSGVHESQAFVHEAASIRRFRGLGEHYLEARIPAQRLIATYFPFVQFLSGVADVIALGVGALLIRDGQLTTGALIAFILWITLFFSPIQQLSQVFDAWQQARVSIHRTSELMAVQTATPAQDQPVDPGRPRGELALNGVHFSYASAGEALSGVDLDVAPGETVALVGETGAGKSTVMKLLARFYDPVHGSVLLDGRDLRTLDLHAFRRQLGYVPQEAFLFSGTVRDNIAFGRPDATDAEVVAAAEAVGAHDMITALDGGYHHELTERGRSLSAGYRQLIALARAQLVDPAVLLLDEATSNLDLVSEARVTAAMHRVAHGRTTVLIAHRLPTARAADRIVVLHAGRVAETGTHDELLAAGGRYAAMWEAFEAVP